MWSSRREEGGLCALLSFGSALLGVWRWLGTLPRRRNFSFFFACASMRGVLLAFVWAGFTLFA